MQYSEAIAFLFDVAPLFQNIGGGAYKEGLSNTLALDEYFGHPHCAYQTIHVSGTNGKGSVSHTLAAILQSAGYRVGLYTSPHLVDFRERIRVNGQMIPEQRVVDFVTELKASPFAERLEGGFSFFELTTALAFLYFKEQQVDIAIIEVGLGGRLDCTNIITPILSVITNISFDHTQFLGHTLEQIAREKAGIIKQGIPVVIGETGGHDAVRQVFLDKALEMGAPITFADEQVLQPIDVEPELKGLCQQKNTATILTAINALFPLSPEAIREGFAHVCSLTGLMGRWQKLQAHPTVVCDTGHNPAGLQYIATQLNTIINAQHSKGKGQLRIVLGMAGDKDVRNSLSLLPQQATYYFTQASVRRAMPAAEIAELGHKLGLEGQPYPSVDQAYSAALTDADESDFIFVGGSSFVVADLLRLLHF